MSISGFFLPSDLTHSHILQFPPAMLSGYCIEACNDYIDIAAQNGISDTSIMIPLPTVAIRYLNNYVNYRFAEDSVAANNTEITDNDMYVVLHKRSYDACRILLKELTPAVIQGVANNNPSSFSVSTGRLHRVE